MKIAKFASLTAALAVTIIPFTASVSAQDAQQADRGNRGGGNRGNFEEFRQRMNERLKTSLKVNDEEWSVIQPLIEKVQTKQREAMGSRFGGFGGGGRRGPGGPGGQGGQGGAQPVSDQSRPGASESQALRTTLENENASADEIKSKLAAVRDQRKKSEAELAQAREDLRKVLTVRQEAALVSMGILE
ncbi:hypothetical protein ACXR0O_22985 [Verrucomicrobiota bacterium sgz303538]